MAKRRRLEISSTEPLSADLETKSAFPPKMRMPIAEVAGDTAGRAALEEVAREMTAAEEEGRVVKRLSIDSVSIAHLSRDRLTLDSEEMEILKVSLAERGQQTPIEVVALEQGYGLISGLRRLEALKAIGETHVLAFIRRHDSAAAAYRAMVEENEVRADLSFYERANLAFVTAGQGVYRTPRDAVAGLFGHAPSSKRSKISKFVVIREALDKYLRFPEAIPEKLGLRLAAAIEADRGIATRLADALRKTPPADAASERSAIERALKGRTSPAGVKDEVTPGVVIQARKGRVVFTGPAVDEAFLREVREWAVSHAKKDSLTS